MTMSTSPSVRKRLTMFGIVGALLASLVVAPPASAQTSTYPSKMAKSSGMYDCVSSSTTCLAKVTDAVAGAKARMVCWQEGRSIDGQKKWFYVVLENGRSGFVPAPRVSSQRTVKSCTDKNASNEIDGVIAANWALSRNKAISVSSSDAATLSRVWGVSSNYTLGDWSGDCISFAIMAWYAAGTKVVLRDAVAVHNIYKAAGKVRTTRNPPRGALVFWNAVDPSTGKNFGHVEISLGNNRSIGTTGWDGNRKPNAIASISYSTAISSKYLGWVMP